MNIIEQFKSNAVKVPADALRFKVDAFASEEGKASDKSVKVHLKARSKAAINHPYWGAVAHDFGTAKIPAKVALDHTHGEEPVGYGRPTLTEYGLEVDGVLTPMEGNPEHPANKLAHSLKAGIPMEASIDFSGSYDVLCVPEGLSTMVNGSQLNGPACVIQNWSLRAVAICKSGADATTETTTFAAGTEAVQPKSITTLSAPKTVEAKPVETPANPAANATETGVEAKPAEELNAQKPPTTEAKAVEAAPVESKPTPTVEQLTAANDRVTVLTGEIEQLKQAHASEIAKLKSEHSAQLEASKKARVSPIEVGEQLAAPKSWDEAFAKLKAQHPDWSDLECWKTAAQQWPKLNEAAKTATLPPK